MEKLSRRDFMSLSAMATAGIVAAACQATPEIIEKETKLNSPKGYHLVNRTWTQGAAAGDPEAMVRPAHTLKSSSANMCAMRLSAEAAKLEQLARAGKLDRAWLVECASMAEERAVPLAEAGERTVPYFSIVLVHGQGRRP